MEIYKLIGDLILKMDDTYIYMNDTKKNQKYKLYILNNSDMFMINNNFINLNRMAEYNTLFFKLDLNDAIFMNNDLKIKLNGSFYVIRNHHDIFFEMR